MDERAEHEGCASHLPRCGSYRVEVAEDVDKVDKFEKIGRGDVEDVARSEAKSQLTAASAVV